MPINNIKTYLAVSIALIVLFLFVTLFPFNKKSVKNQVASDSYPTPTLIDIQQSDNQTLTTSIDFTGVKDEEIPQDIMNSSLQKQDLRNQLPLVLSTFSVDFDYSEDRFVVTLNEPKDQSRQEFNNWRQDTYPAIELSQFNFK